jgi:hypothetical protein
MTQYSIDTDATDQGEAIWDIMKSYISKRETIKSFLLRLTAAYNAARGAGMSHQQIIERIVASTGVPASEAALSEYNRARSDEHGDGLDHGAAAKQAQDIEDAIADTYASASTVLAEYGQARSDDHGNALSHDAAIDQVRERSDESDSA